MDSKKRVTLYMSIMITAEADVVWDADDHFYIQVKPAKAGHSTMTSQTIPVSPEEACVVKDQAVIQMLAQISEAMEKHVAEAHEVQIDHELEVPSGGLKS